MHYIKHARQQCYRVSRLHSDKAKTFLFPMIRACLSQQGVRQTVNFGYDPAGNGLAKRWVGIIKVRVSALLADERNPNPNFLVRMSSGGVGVFHVKRWGPNNSVCPSKPRETKLFGGISRDFWRDRLRNQNLCSILGPSFSLHFGGIQIRSCSSRFFSEIVPQNISEGWSSQNTDS